MKTFKAITMWLCCIFPYVVLQWFSPSCVYMKLPASRIARLRIPLPAEALIARGQTLITLKINPSNGHDYADTWDPCFYTNTPSKSKRIRRLDASEACDDPGNASSCTTPALCHSIYVTPTPWLLGSAPSHWSGSKGRWWESPSL